MMINFIKQLLQPKEPIGKHNLMLGQWLRQGEHGHHNGNWSKR